MKLMLGLQILNKITENILKNHNDPKYRRLDINAEKMKQHIMSRKGTVEFLQKVCICRPSFRCFLTDERATDKAGIP